jgi:hypothetical protein
MAPRTNSFGPPGGAGGGFKRSNGSSHDEPEAQRHARAESGTTSIGRRPSNAAVGLTAAAPTPFAAGTQRVEGLGYSDVLAQAPGATKAALAAEAVADKAEAEAAAAAAARADCMGLHIGALDALGHAASARL